ncbi:hypothetical protein LEN26_012894 [Aphanomyces euteiches]|nr:hypothetical protein LEN26_012894 [Aphanomyces euteiches]KAH9123180.1 hypothetical protein AeMF1_005779 [Aphanomyces euteiches]
MRRWRWLELLDGNDDYISDHIQWKSGLGKPGRPPKLIFKHQAFALVLHFYTAAWEAKTLCEIFGLPPATLTSTLSKAEAASAASQHSLREARVRYPSKATQRLWALQVMAREPLVCGVWGFLDCKNYRVNAPSSIDLQNAMYNGWLHSTFLTVTILFGVVGTIVWCRHNFAGSCDTIHNLQMKLIDESKNLKGHGVVADSAFPVRFELQGRIRTPLKDSDIERTSRACC